MGEEAQNVSISIESQLEMRKGVYSNFASLQSNSNETIINFCFLDGQDESGNMTGVLTSRVIMANDQLAGLRDAIDRQIIANATMSETCDEQ